MSDTRQAWKPWRANTRTAASRITRRLSGPFAPAAGSEALVGATRLAAPPAAVLLALIRAPLPWSSSCVGLLGPAVDVGATVGERRQLFANLVLAVQVEVGDDV